MTMTRRCSVVRIIERKADFVGRGAERNSVGQGRTQPSTSGQRFPFRAQLDGVEAYHADTA